MKKLFLIAVLFACAGVWAMPPRKGAFDENGETRDVEGRNIRAGVNPHEAHIKKSTGGAPNLAPRGLVILVNFADVAFTTPRDTIDSMMNANHFVRSYDYDYIYKDGKQYQGTIIGRGSAKQYFRDQSYGAYNPVFDVVGPYTLSKNVRNYDDSGAKNVIKEACELADTNGADFTLYDNDNDGYVDFVYVIYAGEGEADGGPSYTIWPHNWYLKTRWGVTCVVDGKTIDNYACSNEIQHWEQVYTGIGTFCHEFSHVIGLPDLYYTANSGTSPHTLNEWDILDVGCYNNGGNTPPAYSAYERFYCGWLTPRVLNETEYVWLSPIDNKKALLVCEGNSHNLVGYNPNPQTFYLLEVRTHTGWDEHLPGSGMLITKIQYDSYKWANNTVNNSANAQGVDLIEATPNTATGREQWAYDTDAYPCGGNSWTSFAGHEVTNIVQHDDGRVSFIYRDATPTEQVMVNDEQLAGSRKVLQNGQIYILRNGKTYDILGHENHQL